MIDLKPFSIHETEPSKYVLETSDRYFKINKPTMELLAVIKNNYSKAEALKKINDRLKLALSIDEFDQLVLEKCDHLTLLPNKVYMKRESYVKHKFEVFSASKLAPLINAMRIFFLGKRLVVLALLLCLASILMLFDFIQNDIPTFDRNSVLLFTSLNLVSVFLHETGHISACSAYGAKHGGVGAALYMFWPVAYSDVTGIWALPKLKRIVVNLAGIIIQTLFACLISFLGFIFNYSDIVFIGELLLLLGLLQLIPFARNDGFWVFSDIVGEANILKHGNKLILSVLGKGVWLSKKQKVIIVYVFFNWVFFASYIIVFPLNNLNAFKDLWLVIFTIFTTTDFSVVQSLIKPIFIIVFIYIYVCIRLLYNLVNKIPQLFFKTNSNTINS